MSSVSSGLLLSLKLEGWMPALRVEVAPFGIQTTIVNPGYFGTELLTGQSANYAAIPMADDNKRREQQMQFWKGANGQQSGDPAKLAKAGILVRYRL
jgi:NAD(P)-dependent dehydrogenase (short-subunit alcohol dehydrogenase family)